MNVLPVDQAALSRLVSPEFRSDWRGELPVCAAGIESVVERYRTEGLLSPVDSVFVVAGDRQFIAQAYASPVPMERLTLRVGIESPTDVSIDQMALALETVVDHLFRTTAILRVERQVDARDAVAMTAAGRAGLTREGERRSVSMGDGLPCDVVTFAAVRRDWSARRAAGDSSATKT